MRILILTYPLTAVTTDACGGTEQIAYQILRELASRPEFSLDWIGAEGPAAGAIRPRSWRSLLERYDLSRPWPAEFTPDGLTDLQRRCHRAVALYTSDRPPDLVHNQGAFFARAAASARIPVLFTLHLARRLYPENLFDAPPPNLHFQCVSRTQWQEYRELACCGTIPNGIDLDSFVPRKRPAGANAPLLYLGRICPEKGAHLAIEIARRTRRPLWIAGSAAPFPAHQRYLQQEILPRLGGGIRWIPSPSAADKAALLAAAGAVVLPSLIEETSSLAAMEAAACGVPALALRIGALPEVVAHQKTGWLAGTWEELAAAAARVSLPERRGGIAPAACRAHAEANFSGAAMVARYQALYHRLGQASGRSIAA